MKPRLAVVLAAGEGERLSPLTEHRPKPMLPVANRPLLDHVVLSLANAGIETIVLVVGHHKESIQNYFGDGSQWDVDIEYVVQKPRRGTGDALLQAEARVSEEFIVINGDRIVDSSLIGELLSKRDATGQACLAVTHVEKPSNYGVVSLEDDQVTEIVEKPPKYDIPSRLANTGVYAFGPEVFAAIRQTERRGELGITDVLSEHLEEHPVSAVRYDGLWMDLTEPWDLLSVNAGMLDHTGSLVSERATVHEQATVSGSNAVASDVQIAAGGRLLRDCALGEGVRIGANTVLSNVVVLSDARIGHSCTLQDCIVGEGATIGSDVTIGGGNTDVTLGDTVYRDVRFGGLIGDSVTLGDGVTVDPGTIVGNRTTVQNGSTLEGAIEVDSNVRRG